MSGKRKTGITDEKMRKIAAGGTAAGVLLILFLVVILIVQFVQIGIVNKRKAEYDAEIARYEELPAHLVDKVIAESGHNAE